MTSRKKVGSRSIYTARTPDEISFVEDDIELQNGRKFNYLYAHSPYQVAFVVGIDGDGNVLLIRQHRHLFGEVLIEVPAGSPNAGESLEDGARREFLEESGCFAGSLEKLMTF